MQVTHGYERCTQKHSTCLACQTALKVYMHQSLSYRSIPGGRRRDRGHSSAGCVHGRTLTTFFPQEKTLITKPHSSIIPTIQNSRYNPVFSNLDIINQFYAYQCNNTTLNLKGEDTGKIIKFTIPKLGTKPYVQNLEYKVDKVFWDMRDRKFFNPASKLSEWHELELTHGKEGAESLFDCTTNLLWAVLEFDSKLYHVMDSYKSGHALNKFATDLRNRLFTDSKGHYIRNVKTARSHTKEAHASGMCHLNVFILFDRPIKVIPHWQKDTRKLSWRIKDSEFRFRLKDLWPYGFVDVQALPDFTAFKYSLKYALQNVDISNPDPTALLQASMIHHTRVRTYSLPSSFVTLFNGTVPQRADGIYTNFITISKTSLVIPQEKFHLISITSSRFGYPNSTIPTKAPPPQPSDEDYIQSLLEVEIEGTEIPGKPSTPYTTTPAKHLVWSRNLTNEQAGLAWNSEIVNTFEFKNGHLILIPNPDDPVKANWEEEWE